jgi:hypothetical protein
VARSRGVRTVIDMEENLTQYDLRELATLMDGPHSPLLAVTEQLATGAVPPLSITVTRSQVAVRAPKYLR